MASQAYAVILLQSACRRDVAASVEILQHNPFDEQRSVIRKMRDSLIDGGYMIMLEGVGTDSRPHAFYRPIDGWKEAFEKACFRNIAIQRYYYHWSITAARRLASLRRQLASLIMQRSCGGELSTEETKFNPEKSAEIPEPRRGYLRNLAMRTLVGIDAPMECVLMRRNVALPHHNCGFLFQPI